MRWSNINRMYRYVHWRIIYTILPLLENVICQEDATAIHDTGYKYKYFIIYVIRIMYLYLSTYSRFGTSIGFTIAVLFTYLVCCCRSTTMMILCDDDDDVVKTECFDQMHSGHGALLLTWIIKLLFNTYGHFYTIVRWNLSDFNVY